MGTTTSHEGQYRKSVTNKVQVGSAPGIVESEYFATEAGWDILTVPTPDETYHFSGSENVMFHLKKDGIISWVTDGSVQDKGFKLCMKPENSCPSNGWKPQKGDQCKPNWKYGGQSYQACSTVDYEGKGWCVLEHRRRRRYWIWDDCVRC